MRDHPLLLSPLPEPRWDQGPHPPSRASSPMTMPMRPPGAPDQRRGREFLAASTKMVLLSRRRLDFPAAPLDPSYADLIRTETVSWMAKQKIFRKIPNKATCHRPIGWGRAVLRSRRSWRGRCWYLAVVAAGRVVPCTSPRPRSHPVRGQVRRPRNPR